MRFILSLLASLFIASTAQAQLKIDITRGNFDPLPIAVTALTGPTSTDRNVGDKMREVITANLERSGLFRPISTRAFIETNSSGDAIPRFADWRQINAQGLMKGTISVNGDKMKVAFRLWDILGEQQIAGKEYNTFEKNWRRVAHLISDEIYKRLTGEDGYFDSRIVFVSESGAGTKRVKRLAIMDQDGANVKYLTNGANLVLTPRFSPTSQEILYMSYKGRQPRVYLRDLQTGREESLGRFEGMSFAPRFNHDGNKMVMSIADKGNTELYEMDLRNRRMKRLTNNPGIDTSPSYSPNGKQIVFNSDRGGAQQLYVMNANGSNVRRISFGEGRYGTPVWSPRGDLIAFTKMYKGKFFIGVMRKDGSGERLLTESWLDEGPTWAPNGRVVLFNRQYPSRGGANKSKLFSIDVTGRNLREVRTPMDASDPAWSPLAPL